jgi:hypothetical protein
MRMFDTTPVSSINTNEKYKNELNEKGVPVRTSNAEAPRLVAVLLSRAAAAGRVVGAAAVLVRPIGR